MQMLERMLQCSVSVAYLWHVDKKTVRAVGLWVMCSMGGVSMHQTVLRPPSGVKACPRVERVCCPCGLLS